MNKQLLFDKQNNIENGLTSSLGTHKQNEEHK
jgi:hypothetical protein